MNLEDLPQPARKQIEEMACPGCKRPRRESMLMKFEYISLMQLCAVSGRCVHCGALVKFGVVMSEPPRPEPTPVAPVETPQWAKDLLREDLPPEISR